MQKEIIQLIIRFLDFYLMGHTSDPYYFAIMDVKVDLESIVNKL